MIENDLTTSSLSFFLSPSRKARHTKLNLRITEGARWDWHNKCIVFLVRINQETRTFSRRFKAINPVGLFTDSLPAYVLWGSFVTHSFLPQ